MALFSKENRSHHERCFTLTLAMTRESPVSHNGTTLIIIFL